MTTYRKPVSNTWWLERKQYFFFVIRELTSIFVAGYCLFLLFIISEISDGQENYTLLILSLKSPISLVLHFISLPFILYHTITWFNLTPKIMKLQIGEEIISEKLIVGLVYISWGILSLIIFWLILGV
tara:strand:+ start:111 stop:494 length:384 start_codon:yes stop_codon:yes gene_type:complete